MELKFDNYNCNETDIAICQDTHFKSTTHILIENDGGKESIKIYMSDDDIQNFINKLQKDLDYRNSKDK